MKKVRITLIRSLIDEPEVHRRTIKALGLRKLNHTVEKNLTPQIEGMIKSVNHLLRIKEITIQSKNGKNNELK